MPLVTNIAAYRFAKLTDLKPLRERLLAFCRKNELKGTILLSTEGINLFVAGARESVDALLGELRTIPGLAGLEAKFSESEEQPFSRMLVRIKKEIIAFGVEGIDPASHPSPKLPARTLRQWLDEGRPITLLDTRNDYEVKLGTFKGALPLGIDHFRQFPEAVSRLPEEMKHQPVVMFCTGGIRCEKAGPFMEREGFQQIFQLDGGILKYFEECGGDHYEGECFVFDQRVGVDPALSETGTAQCFVCQAPLTPMEQRDRRYVAGESCPHCHRPPEQTRAEIIAARQAALAAATTPLPGSTPRDNLRPINVPGTFEGSTLLEMLSAIFSHIPTAEWETRCAAGRILDRAHAPASATHTVRPGERFYWVEHQQIEPAVNARLHLLHEDEALAIFAKPAPLPMHPGGRFNRNTLQSILQTAYAPQRPRPVHRLDANTTGVLVCARTRHFAALLQPQFEENRVEKIYLARVAGHPENDFFQCDAAIGREPLDAGARTVDRDNGLPAQTDFEVLARDPDGTTLLRVRPRTGRTNQIRIHLWHLGFPVCGDPTYLATRQLGSKQTLDVGDSPLCLHAASIRFEHPISKERVTFQAPAPEWATLSASA